jgi:hypothetical protein
MASVFEIAAEQAESINPDATVVTIKLPSGEYDTRTPTSGQIVMFQTRLGNGDGSEAIFKLLESVVDVGAVEEIQQMLDDGELSFDTISELIQWLIGEWTARPTKSSSVSSASRKATGKQSTIKQPAKAKTS